MDKIKRIISMGLCLFVFLTGFELNIYASEGVEDVPGVEVCESTENIPNNNYIDIDYNYSTASSGAALCLGASAVPRLNASAEELDESIPSFYDVSSTLPKVRNQNPYGSCWSFSSIGLAEMSILSQESIYRDFSELQLCYFMVNNVPSLYGNTTNDSNTINYNYDKYIAYENEMGLPISFMDIGGNLEYSYNIFSAWTGVVNEDDVPYSSASDVISNGLPDSYAYDYNQAHLRNVYKISKYDTNDVKKAIMKYGAVGCSYRQEANYYNSTYNSYYYSAGANSTNHAITVVGWDDNFSKDNFNQPAANDGAWLIRNSWGYNGYGNGGYFWLSYDDPTLNTVMYVFDFVSNESDDYYDCNYQYDGSVANSETNRQRSFVKAANVFKVQNDKEILKAIMFGTKYSGAKYTVNIYVNPTDSSNPESGTLSSTTTGVVEYEGLLSVKLDSEVLLNKNDVYAVVVSLEKEGAFLGFATETNSSSFISSVASANPGESFRWTGSTWEDYSAKNNKNIRIKAFTNIYKEPETSVAQNTGVKIQGDKNLTMYTIDALRLSAMLLPTNKVANSEEIIWSVSDESIATVLPSGVVIPNKPGSITIYATTRDGKYKDSVTVAIKKNSVDSLRFDLGDKTSITAYTGDVITMPVVSAPTEVAASKMEWSSSDERVVTVKDGVVTAVGCGTATVTVKYERCVAFCNIVVNVGKFKVTALQTSDNEVTVSWDKIGNISEVKIYAYSTIDSKETLVATITNNQKLSWVDPDAKCKSRIYYNLVARYNGSFNSERGSYSYVGLKDVVIRSAWNTDEGIRLNFNAVPGATDYRLYRKDDAGKYVLQKDAKLYDGYIVDKNVVLGKSYTYTIAAVNNNVLIGMVAENYNTTGTSNVYLGKTALSSITNSSAGVVLKWGKMTGCKGYYVYRKLESEASYTLIATISSPDTLTYTDKTATNGAKYIYYVSPFNGKSTGPSVASVITRLATPKITAISSKPSGITITWEKVAGAEGYYLYRKKSTDSAYSYIANIAKPTTVSYVDSGAINGNTYSYYLKAYCGNSYNQSNASSVYKMEVPKLTSVANVSSGIEIKWNKVTKATSYNVYRKSGTQTSYTLISKGLSATTTSYIDKSPANGVKNIYYIAACCTNSYNNSATSSLIRLVAPKITSVANQTAGIKLSWNKVSGSTGYYIYRKKSADKSYSLLTNIKSGSTLTYTDKSASGGTGYNYYIKAYSSNGNSVATYTDIVRLATPSVTSVANTSTGVKLVWKTVSGGKGFYVYRKKTTDKSYTKIATLGSKTTSYVDKSASNGIAYQYIIKAYNGKYVSSYTTKTIARLTTPSISSVSNAKGLKMSVKWNRNTSAGGYQIKYVVGSTTKTITINGNASVSKTISSLKKGSTYKVYVRSFKKVSNVTYYSAWSAAKSVKITK